MVSQEKLGKESLWNRKTHGLLFGRRRSLNVCHGAADSRSNNFLILPASKKGSEEWSPSARVVESRSGQEAELLRLY